MIRQRSLLEDLTWVAIYPLWRSIHHLAQMWSRTGPCIVPQVSTLKRYLTGFMLILFVCVTSHLHFSVWLMLLCSWCITLCFLLTGVRRSSVNSAAPLSGSTLTPYTCDWVSVAQGTLHWLLAHNLSRPFIDDGSSQRLAGSDCVPPEFYWATQLNDTVLTVLQKTALSFILKKCQRPITVV